MSTAIQELVPLLEPGKFPFVVPHDSKKWAGGPGGPPLKFCQVHLELWPGIIKILAGRPGGPPPKFRQVHLELWLGIMEEWAGHPGGPPPILCRALPELIARKPPLKTKSGRPVLQRGQDPHVHLIQEVHYLRSKKASLRSIRSRRLRRGPLIFQRIVGFRTKVQPGRAISDSLYSSNAQRS